MIPGLTFDEATHTYRKDGAVVPSVTTILKPLYSFDGIPAHVLAAKAALGTATHKAIELDDLGELDESSVDPQVQPYLDAYRLFKSRVKPVVLASEQRGYHPAHRYAGTIDSVMEIEGKKYVVDFKTTVAMSPVIGIQLAGYAELIRVGAEQISRAALQLKPNGFYELHDFKSISDFPMFLSLLNIYRWREKYAS